MQSHNSRGWRMTFALALAVFSGCGTDATPFAPDTVADVVIEADAARFHDGNAPAYWNRVARDLVATSLSSTPFAIRGYAIVSIAQYHAATAADRGRRGRDHGAVRAAVSAASVVALSYLFPTEAPALEARLEDYLRRGGDESEAMALGRAAAEEVVARAKTDGFFAQWTGSVPTGPGIWYSSTVPPTAPSGAAFGQARPFLLRSTAQFRPAAPPAFGSARFRAGLAEVRAFSDGRTPKQDSLAKFWHLPAGTYAPPGYWNEEASRLALKYRLDARATAHLLAVMNIVSFDGLLASHEAKFTYWLVRPSQADGDIELSVPLPNFPSYPSNHATISAGSARVLERAFPWERKRLRALAEQAAMSRVFGGIHYRFDGEAGIALGHRIADWTIARAAKRNEPFALR